MFDNQRLHMLKGWSEKVTVEVKDSWGRPPISTKSLGQQAAAVAEGLTGQPLQGVCRKVWEAREQS